MNTPDTERAIDVQRYHLGLAFKSILASENPEESFVEYISSRDTYWKEQMEKGVLKGERRRIIEQIREERDTYWKERLLQSIKDTNFLEKIEDEQDNRNSGIEVYRRIRDHIKAFTPITNEDNLK